MIENTQLAALVASRLCHDMVGPMNAMIQGVDMLKTGDGKADPDAVSLIESGVNMSWAKLEFYRFAIADTVAEGDSTLEEARKVADRLYSEFKADLSWKAPAVAMPRRAVRVVMNLLYIANDCLPRGGVVEMTAEPEGEGGAVHIVSSGARAMLKSVTAAALRGEMPVSELSGHSLQPFLTNLFARQAGVDVTITEAPERIEIIARSASFKV
jgi:histidine phosphotransferase ChpT